MARRRTRRKTDGKVYGQFINSAQAGLSVGKIGANIYKAVNNAIQSNSLRPSSRILHSKTKKKTQNAKFVIAMNGDGNTVSFSEKLKDSQISKLYKTMGSAQYWFQDGTGMLEGTRGRQTYAEVTAGNYTDLATSTLALGANAGAGAIGKLYIESLTVKCLLTNVSTATQVVHLYHFKCTKNTPTKAVPAITNGFLQRTYATLAKSIDTSVNVFMDPRKSQIFNSNYKIVKEKLIYLKPGEFINVSQYWEIEKKINFTEEFAKNQLTVGSGGAGSSGVPAANTELAKTTRGLLIKFYGMPDQNAADDVVSTSDGNITYVKQTSVKWRTLQNDTVELSKMYYGETSSTVGGSNLTTTGTGQVMDIEGTKHTYSDTTT